MEKLFDMDGNVYRLLTIGYNLIVLNVLLVITSLPLITAGASITAAFSVLNECKKGQLVISVKDYFDYFQKYSKKSMMLTTIQLCILLLLVFMVVTSSSIAYIQLLMIILLSLSMLIMSWTHALLSFDNRGIKSLLSLSAVIALKLTAYSVVFFIIPIFSLMAVIFLPGILYPYILFIFSFPLYLQSFIFEVVIKKLKKDYEWSPVENDSNV